MCQYIHIIRYITTFVTCTTFMVPLTELDALSHNFLQGRLFNFLSQNIHHKPARTITWIQPLLDDLWIEQNTTTDQRWTWQHGFQSHTLRHREENIIAEIRTDYYVKAVDTSSGVYLLSVIRHKNREVWGFAAVYEYDLHRLSVFTRQRNSTGNYYRCVAKYGGRRSKSSVAKVNPLCFVVAENTPKIPRSRMVCCCCAHAHVPVLGDAVEDVR